MNDQANEKNTASILVAGIGNIFNRDDAFGPEVVKHLRSQEFPKEVEIIDFGISGVDLLYELMKGYEILIIIDALKTDNTSKGKVFVLEPKIDAKSDTIQSGHGIDSLAVLSLAKSQGILANKVVIVGCEPVTIQEGIGLSDEMKASVQVASKLVKSLIRDFREEKIVMKG